MCLCFLSFTWLTLKQYQNGCKMLFMYRIFRDSGNVLKCKIVFYLPSQSQRVECPGVHLIESEADGCSVRQLTSGKVVHQGNFLNSSLFCEQPNIQNLEKILK